MQLKRFVAKDNHSALKLVKESLGPDAIIVSNRAVSEGVEILATAGLDELSIEQSIDVDTGRSAPPTVNKKSSGRVTSETFSNALNSAEENVELNDMRAEIAKLRSVLDAEISAMKVGHWGQQSQARAELFEKLSRIGLGVDLVTQLVSCTDVTDDLQTASKKVLVKLKESIRISQHDPVEQGGIVVLHGPTGAGKTTTIAKLAARFLLKNDTQDLVMVCADNARIGAQEQLETYGKLLGVSVVSLRDSNDIDTLLGLLSDKKLVLLDTGGLTQSDLREPHLLIGMNKQLENVHHYLVVAATMQRSALERVFEVFANMNIKGTILTKMDEAIHLGDVMTSVLRNNIALSSWSDGQNIASDLHRADAALLVTKAMHLNKMACESKDDRILLSMLQNAGQKDQLWGQGV